jgi:hypothetical protein
MLWDPLTSAAERPDGAVVGMVLGLIGSDIAVNSFWLLMMLVPFVLVIRCSVSSHEEAFLARKFGYVYCRYRAPGPKACSPIRLQPAFAERGEARQLTRWSSVSRNAPSR